MIRFITLKYDQFIKKFKLEAFREVFIFILILLFLHILWKLWDLAEFKVFGYDIMNPVFGFLTDSLRVTAAWFCNDVLGIQAVIQGELLVNSEWVRMGVTVGCSGLKQFYQFAGLMLLYPGPWKKKAWFIPSGLAIIHLTNLFRIILLYIVVINKLEWFNTIHDWILRPLFYVVMFLLWVWWVEKLAKRRKEASNEKISN